MEFAVRTFGCRLNRAESLKFEQKLAAAGLTLVEYGKEPPALVLFHTCAITQSAQSECCSAVRQCRRRNPDALIVASGCAVDAEGAEAFKAATGADIVLPFADKARVAEIVLERLGLEMPAGDTPFTDSLSRGLLKVQDGCPFECTYCIVPHVRGKPVSRPFEECLCEARRMVEYGFREVVVTGCNLACYRDGARRLPELVDALAALPGMGRVRIGSMEPCINDRPLIDVMAANPKICSFLHVPIQSGDPEVLARMGRRYTLEELRATLDYAVERLPQVGLGTDLITGFPGEREENAANTYRLISEYPFSNLHVFPYSERPGHTPAPLYKGIVRNDIRQARAERLIRLGDEKRIEFARRWIGREVEVLVERYTAEGAATGWSREYLQCRVEGADAGLERELLVFVPERVDGEVLVGKIKNQGE